MTLHEISQLIGPWVDERFDAEDTQVRLAKLREEITEVHRAINDGDGNVGEELVDVIIVCCNIAHHRGINLDPVLMWKLPQVLAKPGK